jgi:hypothetical protein
LFTHLPFVFGATTTATLSVTSTTILFKSGLVVEEYRFPHVHYPLGVQRFVSHCFVLARRGRR